MKGKKRDQFPISELLQNLSERRLADNTNSNSNTNSNEIHMLQAREHTVYTKECTNSKLFAPTI